MVKETKGGDNTNKNSGQKAEVDKKAIQEEITSITRQLADVEDHLTAIKNKTEENYFARKYIQYREQTQDKYNNKRLEYKDIRENRDKHIKRIEKEGVDTTEMENKLMNLCNEIVLIPAGDSISEIVDKAKEIVKANLLIEEADKNIQKYCREKYREDKQKAKQNFEEARDKYKEVRTNRNSVIEEFKEIEVNVEGLAEVKEGLLISLQENMNKLNPPA